MSKELYVSSACCTWHGPISETRATPPAVVRVGNRIIDAGGVPCCPHCGSVLYQNKSRAEFDESARRFMADNMGGDESYLAWLQSLHDSGTCRPIAGWDWRADFKSWKEKNVNAG